MFSSVVIGLVSSVDDPDKLGRVQVTFPWLSEDNRSTWARLATLHAGPGRGSYFLPEVDDEVLVAFNHGDPRDPYIIGFLWNGVDTPPNRDIPTPDVRRLRTKSGHQLDFDDRSQKERIHLKSSQGHEVLLDDKRDQGPEAKISAVTRGGHAVLLDDKPTDQKILIKSTGQRSIEIRDTPLASITVQVAGVTVTIQETPAGISVMAPAGTVSVTCLSATVTATTNVTVTAPAGLTIAAPMATFAGIIQAPMLQAGMVQAGALVSGAVVGAAYTPAPGNTFGL